MKKNSKKNIVAMTTQSIMSLLKMVTDIMVTNVVFVVSYCKQDRRKKKMNDEDVKQQALEQAQQAYGLFIWFVKWFSYVMIALIILMFMNNWFDDGTGSRFMPDEIVDDQYDPKGLNKKKGI